MEDLLENGKLLLDAFGRWPSFHDGEVHLVRFRFEDLGNSELGGFNHQNAIFELCISKVADDSTGRIRVEFDPSFGIGGEFIAARGRVVSVNPCDSEGRLLTD